MNRYVFMEYGLVFTACQLMFSFSLREVGVQVTNDNYNLQKVIALRNYNYNNLYKVSRIPDKFLAYILIASILTH